MTSKTMMPAWLPALSIIVLVTAAGRVFGLDQFLHRRLPRVPLW